MSKFLITEGVVGWLGKCSIKPNVGCLIQWYRIVLSWLIDIMTDLVDIRARHIKQF